MEQLVYPVFGFVIWVFFVKYFSMAVRIKAVKTGEVHIKEFKVIREDALSEKLANVGRVYANLFEMPILFLAAVVFAMALNVTSGLLIGLAWAYLVCRVFQGGIQLSYNNVMHRMYAFVLGNLVLLAMWVVILLAAI